MPARPARLAAARRARPRESLRRATNRVSSWVRAAAPGLLTEEPTRRSRARDGPLLGHTGGGAHLQPDAVRIEEEDPAGFECVAVRNDSAVVQQCDAQPLNLVADAL